MKRSELKEFIREEIIEILSEATPKDVENQKAYNDELAKTKELMSDLEGGIDENESAEAASINTIANEPISEEEEPTDADLKKTDSIAKVASKLADVTKEMRTTVNQYKKAEGEEKESLLKRLKDLTKIKKELEGLL